MSDEYYEYQTTHSLPPQPVSTAFTRTVNHRELNDKLPLLLLSLCFSSSQIKGEEEKILLLLSPPPLPPHSSSSPPPLPPVILLIQLLLLIELITGKDDKLVLYYCWSSCNYCWN